MNLLRPVNANRNSDYARSMAAGHIREPGMGLHWTQWRIAVGEFTPEDDTSQVLNLNALFPNKQIPDYCITHNAFLYVETPFSGGSVSAAVALFGHAALSPVVADDNGFFESTSVFTGVGTGHRTTAMAARGRMFNGTMVPQLTIGTVNGNIDDLTAGALVVGLQWSLFPPPITE